LLSRPAQQGNLPAPVARWRKPIAAREERRSPSFRKRLRRRAQLQFAESASACFERARSFRFSFLCASYMMSARQQKRWIQLDDGVGDTFVLVIVALSDLSRCGPSSPRSLSTRLWRQAYWSAPVLPGIPRRRGRESTRPAHGCSRTGWSPAAKTRAKRKWPFLTP